jgi:hypothetical protein
LSTPGGDDQATPGPAGRHAAHTTTLPPCTQTPAVTGPSSSLQRPSEARPRC